MVWVDLKQMCLFLLNTNEISEKLLSIFHSTTTTNTSTIANEMRNTNLVSIENYHIPSTSSFVPTHHYVTWSASDFYVFENTFNANLFTNDTFQTVTENQPKSKHTCSSSKGSIGYNVLRAKHDFMKPALSIEILALCTLVKRKKT